MSLNNYKLSCELFGHSLDVRSVTEGHMGTIVSGSRDKTAKVWGSDGAAYVEQLTLKDHTNFVTSVCVLENGSLICTGSQDRTICVYATGNMVPLAILRGHTDTVCSLAAGIESNTLISGSWDKTARVWTIAGFGPSSSFALVGHEMAVWSVATIPSSKQFVTGSADKTISFWNLCGEKLKVLKGHTDCVRGVLGLANGGLVSCANDTTLRYWSSDGDGVKELHGHGHYIYSVALNKSLGNDVVVTGSEDSTIRMWSKDGGQLGDPIKLPAESVWSVACLQNGDIVAGTSDGVVRVFTMDKERQADAAVQNAFMSAVQTRDLEANMELGGVKVTELPGPESLLAEGKTEGQTKIVRHADGKLKCYQWSAGEWLLMGDVTGAAGGSQQKSGKVLHEGRQYDYVFSVDISDNGVPLKLPYDCDQEPWLVAQKFIHQHELPQAYLEQVANFIIKNSTDRAPTSQTTASGFQDPFTGSGRYVPGNSSANTNTHSNTSDFVDPFTGASSYRTTASTSAASTNGTAPPRVDVQFKAPTKTAHKHFPHSTYTTFSSCDAAKVLIKIKEFNEKLTDGSLKVSETTLDKVIKFASAEPAAAQEHVEYLQPLLKWPKEILFPILDVARLAVRDQGVCTKLANASFLQLIVDNINHGPANQLMAVRCICNMMSHGWGRGIVEDRLGDIFDKLNQSTSGSANLQIAIASLFLNVSATQLTVADQEVCRLTTEGLLDFLRWAGEAEAFYRAYQALGNLTCTPYGAISSAQIVSVDQVIDRLRDHMSATQAPGMEKLNDLARELTAAL